MSKLVYGENGQVRFFSEEEKREAIEYILTSPTPLTRLKLFFMLLFVTFRTSPS